MNKKKLNLRKVTITRLSDLQSIKGGVPACSILEKKSCTTKPFEDDSFTETGTLDDGTPFN